MLLYLLPALIFGVQVAYLVALGLGLERAVKAWSAGSGRQNERIPPPVSVIVAARNEEDNLPALLEALTEQRHPDFEVVVVDDASTDRTGEISAQWKTRLPNLRVIRVEQPVHPRKKNALTRGIAKARHPHLALTDADCLPAPSWLHEGTPTDEETLVIGYSPYRPERTILNLFARYETLVTGQQTAAAVGLGRPFMAVGRSIFYSKRVFDRADGFSGTLRSLSGDDDLFLQQVVKRRAARVRHLFGRDSLVWTDAPGTWRAWFRQKTRHTSAGRFYPLSMKLHLGAYHMTSLLLWLAPFLWGWTGAVLLAIRLAGQTLVMHRAGRQLSDDTIPTYLIPPLELLYVLYNSIVVPLGLARVPREW